MTELDDHELLAQFARTQSEAAFAALVERHVNLVYSAALRFTGNPHHAEEITQAVFIILARKAGSLRRGTVLSGWLYQTARLTAANFVKGEIRRRNREQEFYMQSTLTEPETAAWERVEPLLDEAMGRLGETDRNAVVLRFFENKTTQEVATTLKMNEAAAHKRVSRALNKLHKFFTKRGVTLTTVAIAGAMAANSVQAAPAGLATTVVTTAAKGAMATVGVGIGTKIISTFSKTLLFSWFVPLLSLIGTLPSLAFVSIVGRMERKNFRDPQGFRLQLHRLSFRSYIWGFPLVVVIVAIVNHSALAAWGISGQQLALVCFLLIITLISARSLTICRNQFQVGMFAYCVIILVGISARALGWIPQSLAQLPLLAATLVFFLIFKQRPTRMDYSLILRAAQKMLKFSVKADDAAQGNRFDRRQLLAFARFLGSRFLVCNFRWGKNGLVLRLPPVRNRFLTTMASGFMPPISQKCSQILLGWNGTVIALCGKSDLLDLSALKTTGMTDPRELESFVAEIVSQAWQQFRNGNLSAAEFTLGEAPDSEVFVVPPGRAKSTRWWRIFIGANVILMMAGIILQFWRLPAWINGLRPVSVTEAEVRGFLNDATPNPDPKKYKFNSAGLALFNCLVLPPTNLFSAGGFRAMEDQIAHGSGSDSLKQNDWRTNWVFDSPLVRRALFGGWVTWNDLGIQRPDLAVFLHTNHFQINSPEKWDYFLARGAAWSWVKQEGFDVMRIQFEGVGRLWLLRDVNCLDLTDPEKLIQQISSVQTLSGTPPGQPPIHDWRDVRGLFFTSCWPALQDTYFSLAALEILGGLDRINREACIEGILNRHRGRGYFTSPDSGGFNEYHIDGSARDTIAAFESLRILGALDRVKDLEKWEFRVSSRNSSKPAANGVRNLTWNEVEAWACQQRLKTIIKERTGNPQKPFGSLLDTHGL